MSEKNKTYKRIFYEDDQQIFSKLSGDYNPLHIDKIFSRKLLFGSPVVHGINMLLWALDCWIGQQKKKIELNSINTSFYKALNVGDELNFESKNFNNNVKIELKCENILMASIDFVWHYSNNKISPSFSKENPKKINVFDVQKKNILDAFGEIELCLNQKVFKKLFSNLNKFFPNLQSAILLASTRLVGMICPGLNSIYCQLTLTFSNQIRSNHLTYKVNKFDSRFNLVYIKATGNSFQGIIKSFIRPKNIKLINFKSVKKTVIENEFKNQSSIIIGGSRGIGEATAKLLAAGAADIKLSYNSGEDDAKKIINEINTNGGNADYFKYNVLSSNNKSFEKIIESWNPTHLYYFATPFIFVGNRNIFSDKKYKKFYEYYVSAFDKIMNILINKGLKKAFYPSTTAIDENPSDMQEYISAKKSGEKLCNKFEQKDNTLKIYKPRLPRLETDQTVSLFSVLNKDPFPIQLKHLRIFRDYNEI